jgi:hypothetical protein
MPTPPSPESKRPAAWGSDKANSHSKFRNQVSTTADSLDQARFARAVCVEVQS